jgi:hypothetical protein
MCHEYGNFTKNCKKADSANIASGNKEEQWHEVSHKFGNFGSKNPYTVGPLNRSKYPSVAGPSRAPNIRGSVANGPISPSAFPRSLIGTHAIEGFASKNIFESLSQIEDGLVVIVENNSNQEQPSVQSLIDSLTRNKGFIKQ